MSRLIRSYAVCQSDFDFVLKPLFASVDISKFKDGRIHFRNRVERINMVLMLFYFQFLIYEVLAHMQAMMQS